jgi:hypothetical protein
MKTSLRKAATPPRHTAPRDNERRLVTPHPRRRVLSLAAGAAVLPTVTRFSWARPIRRDRCAGSSRIRLAGQPTSSRA